MKPILTVIANRPLNTFLPTGSHDTLDVLIRVQVPQAESSQRQPLDLALAIDVSGSMKGLPLELAKAATKLILSQLQPSDRIALVTFHSHAEVVFPLQPVTDLAALERLVDGLRVGGSTALYAGWQTASSLLMPGALEGRLSRTLLLTDGRANVGLRDPSGLAAQFSVAQIQGVSSSSVGVGLRYDEQLLEQLAGAGDGNYHFAERPDELSGIFEAELHSLRGTLGRRVSLGIKGAVVKDALNDLPRLSTGRSALPPLRSGQTLDLVYRLEVQAKTTLELRLAWDDHQGERQTERLSIHLPAAPLNGSAPEHAEVVQARERLLVARAQREIARLADVGDLSGASVLISGLRNRLMVEGMRSGVSLQTELQQLADLEARLRRHDRASVSKVARKQSYDKMTGREQN
ncbi:vWA domain-containing protein [Deinococcus psychrotolerans]|nr:VWA domain-containing protein [Deinococcus psychrotolerans]